MNPNFTKLIIATLTVACLSSCNSQQEKAKELTDKEQLSEVYHPDNLHSQSFRIDPTKDTVIQGANGTKLTISKNTFVDLKGRLVTDAVDVELKEALNPFAIVKSNLTTTSNGKPLQTGGMIFVNARSEDWPVKIASEKSIGVAIPTKENREGMQFFKGTETANGINWIEPTALKEPAKPAEGTAIPAAPDEQSVANQVVRRSVSFSRDDFELIFDYVDSIAPKLPKNGRVQGVAFEEQKPSRGINSFSVDLNTEYIFEMKNLGWANIDRFYEDSRTQEVELVTTITNHAQFDEIMITMVASDMYLPGYQMKNGRFSFTHDDDEKPMLPVGEKAVFFATTYKDGIPYFALVKTTISEKGMVTLTLNPTTVEDVHCRLKQEL